MLSLFASPLARGLFHKGIVQNAYSVPDVSRAEALKKARRWPVIFTCQMPAQINGVRFAGDTTVFSHQLAGETHWPAWHPRGDTPLRFGRQGQPFVMGALVHLRHQ